MQLYKFGLEFAYQVVTQAILARLPCGFAWPIFPFQFIKDLAVVQELLAADPLNCPLLLAHCLWNSRARSLANKSNQPNQWGICVYAGSFRFAGHSRTAALHAVALALNTRRFDRDDLYERRGRCAYKNKKHTFVRRTQVLRMYAVS